MRHQLYFFVCIFLSISLWGCRKDSDFNLENLDPEVTVLKTDLSYPFGLAVKQRVGNLLDLDGYSVLKCIENGDYYLDIQPSPFLIPIMIPENGTLSYEFEPINYSVNSIPKVLEGGDADLRLDWTQSDVVLGFDSGIPATLHVGIGFDTYWDGGRQPFFFASLPIVPGKSEVVIQDDSLFSTIPDGVAFKEISFSVDPDQMDMLTQGSLYWVTVSPCLRAPLAFAVGSVFHYDIPINRHFSMPEDIRIVKAVVDLSIVNTIPLDFEVSGHFEDGSGQRLDGVSISVDGDVPGGTLDIPAETSVRATITSSKGNLAGDCFVVELTGRTTERTAGVHFNRNQYVEFKNIRVRLPEGVQVDIF